MSEYSFANKINKTNGLKWFIPVQKKKKRQKRDPPKKDKKTVKQNQMIPTAFPASNRNYPVSKQHNRRTLPQLMKIQKP